MRRLVYIAFVVGTLCCALRTPVAAQDYERLSESSTLGTARYMGMAGAMTAVGADPSAAIDNPAGLGFYRRSEVMMSIGGHFDRAWQDGTTNYGRARRASLPQASIVLAFGEHYANNTCYQNAIMFSYRRTHDYSRRLTLMDIDQPSLGDLLNEYQIKRGIPYPTERTNIGYRQDIWESGAAHEYAFDWGMSINHRWYVGLGLHVQSYMLASDGLYYEQFATLNADSANHDIENKTGLTLNGVGCKLAVGLIYRPAQWARVGVSLHTPSLGSVSTYTSGVFSALTDTLRYSYAPDGRRSAQDFHMPLRLSVGAAFTLGNFGMLSLQYDYRHNFYSDDLHALRGGLEISPVEGLYLNAGYAWETTFRTSNRRVDIDPEFKRQDTYYCHHLSSQYASAGIGYRGKHFMIQAAYQYRWQTYHYNAHQNADTQLLRTDTHRFVITLGWHRSNP